MSKEKPPVAEVLKDYLLVLSYLDGASVRTDNVVVSWTKVSVANLMPYVAMLAKQYRSQNREFLSVTNIIRLET